MVAAVDTDEQFAAIEAGARRMHAAALDAGFGARVPTCPQWRVRDLLAHTGMVHRWARAQVLGTPAPFDSAEAVLSRVHSYDLPAWLLDGAFDLVVAFREAPEDLSVWVFLETGRTPREFWIRRQMHETVIHAVDATAAATGSTPTLADLPATLTQVLTPEVASDGLDELLVRFAPLGRSKLFDGAPLTISVEADDTDAAWTLTVTEESLVVTEGAAERFDARWHADAAALYLGMWNRGDEVAVDGDADTLARWRSRHTIRF